MFAFACKQGCENVAHGMLSDGFRIEYECSWCLSDMQRMRPVFFADHLDTRWQGQLGLPVALQLIGGKWPSRTASYGVARDFKIERNGRLRALNPREPDGEGSENWWFEYLDVRFDDRGLPVPVGCLAVV